MAASCHRSEFTQPIGPAFLTIAVLPFLAKTSGSPPCLLCIGRKGTLSGEAFMYILPAPSLCTAISGKMSLPYYKFWPQFLFKTSFEDPSLLSLEELLPRKERELSSTLSREAFVYCLPLICVLPFMTKCVKCTANNCVPHLVHMTSFAALTLAWVKIFIMNDCHFSL